MHKKNEKTEKWNVSVKDYSRPFIALYERIYPVKNRKG